MYENQLLFNVGICPDWIPEAHVNPHQPPNDLDLGLSGLAAESALPKQWKTAHFLSDCTECARTCRLLPGEAGVTGT